MTLALYAKCVSVLLLTLSSHIVSSQVLYDITTGLGNVGTTDPIWQVKSPTSSTFSNIVISTGMINNGTTTSNAYVQDVCGQYISPYLNSSNHIIQDGASSGTYTYKAEINITESFSCIDSVRLNFQFIAADNSLEEVRVNGTPFTPPPNITHTSPGSLNALVPISSITSGINTIEVDVHNISLYTALQLCGQVEVYTNSTQVLDIINPSDTTLCPGGQLVLDIGLGSPSEYLWNTGSTDSILTITQAGTYWASANCGLPDTLVVNYYPPLESQLENTVSCEGQSVVLSYYAPNAEYIWNNGESTSAITVHKEGIYTVSVTNGCETFLDSARVVFEDCSESPFYVPNAFTPNMDGTNDAFLIKGFKENDFHIFIFDRWGNAVFESIDPNFAWDGTFEDQLCREGTYVYMINYTTRLNDYRSKSGIVSLMR